MKEQRGWGKEAARKLEGGGKESREKERRQVG